MQSIQRNLSMKICVVSKLETPKYIIYERVDNINEELLNSANQDSWKNISLSWLR